MHATTSVLRRGPRPASDRLFRRCLTVSATCGLLLMVGLAWVPSVDTSFQSLDAVPERLAKLILTKPAPPSPRPAPPKTAGVAPEAAPSAAPRVAPKTVQATLAQAASSSKEAAATGEHGRERARQVQKALAAGGLLERVDRVLASAGSGGHRVSPAAAQGTQSKALAAAAAAEVGAERVAAQVASAQGAGGDQALAPAQVDIQPLAVPAADASRSNESLMAVVARYAGGIKHCYDTALRDAPDLAGRLVLSVTVEPHGAVSRVRVVGNTISDRRLAECVTAQTKTWKFPRVDGASVAFRCPLVFSPPRN